MPGLLVFKAYVYIVGTSTTDWSVIGDCILSAFALVWFIQTCYLLLPPWKGPQQKKCLTLFRDANDHEQEKEEARKEGERDEFAAIVQVRFGVFWNHIVAFTSSNM